MNAIYLFYFIFNSDYSYLKKEFKKIENKNTLITIIDMCFSTLKYGSSLEDYFIYEFYNENSDIRKTYVTTGFAKSFFKQMNDSRSIKPFRDKEIFDTKYSEFIKRDTIILNKTSKANFIKWCNNKNEVIVKPLDGVQGKGIYKACVKQEKEVIKLYSKIKNKNYIVEELIQQHSILNELNDSCVNSIRVITVNINNKPRVIAAILRIGVGAIVDNFSEGGIAAPIDLETGIIFKDGITRDKSIKVKNHPLTKVAIKGLKIPYWNEVREVVLKASQITPLVKTVGWDIAITQDGPDIIEGNDNWNKNIFQLPFDMGKKEELKQLMKEDRCRK